MCTTIEKAVELYNRACTAEEQGELNLAEVYYLKSWAAFEKAGGRHALNAANALNALAFLREARGNHEGAMSSAKRSLRIVEDYRMQFQSSDADLIHMQARDLIEILVGGEMSSMRSLVSAAA